MKAARPVGSLRSLGDGRYRVVVSAGYDPFTHKRRRLARTVDGGRRAAEQARASLLVEAGQPLPAADLTLRTYLEDVWLPMLRLRQRTVIGYRSKIAHQIVPYIGQRQLSDLSPFLLEQWLGRLDEDGVGRLTARHAYRVLHAALARAVKGRLIPTNPLDAVSPPKAQAYQPRVADAPTANAILDAFAGHDLEPIVVLALAAGLRRSELAALTWSDLDFDAGTVTVSKGRHQVKGRVFDEPPKSASSRRTVSLPRWALAALGARRGSGLVAGKRTPAAITAAYAKRLAERGLPHIPLKDLRHTHATLALAAGVDVVVVSRRLGHSSVAVTDAFYLRPGRAADADAAIKIEALRSVCPNVPNDSETPECAER